MQHHCFLDISADAGPLVKGIERPYSLFFLMMVENGLVSGSVAWHVHLDFLDYFNPYNCCLPLPQTELPLWNIRLFAWANWLISLSLRNRPSFLAQDLRVFVCLFVFCFLSCFSLNRSFVSALYKENEHVLLFEISGVFFFFWVSIYPSIFTPKCYNQISTFQC